MNHSQGPSAIELAERYRTVPNEFLTGSATCSGPNSNSRAATESSKIQLPDVANEHRPEISGHLDRVGMSGIELIARFQGPDQLPFLVPANADAYVSLDDDSVKGIHMSRLFLELASAMECESLTPSLMNRVCENFLVSHAGISKRAELSLSFQHPAFRPALLSDYSAPRHYPVRLSMVSDTREAARVRAGEHVRLFVQVQVVYSSTCPCSAALSRQLLEQKFQKDFAFHNWVNVSQVSQWLIENGSVATPHSQRSVATIDVELANPLELKRFPIERIIDRIEGTLKTAVQTVVKRQDEQEFARLNGANQMFCEDAARRMKATLLDMPEILDFRVEARHKESLHPHDAVAIATAGIAGGMTA
ncbi:MAG: GTP cyclohydrolase I FolE2 [Planctomycetaceae bacterium]|nr:GTP cyclohydrolase I FolE2 [Planctomycetaceae bacterium]